MYAKEHECQPWVVGKRNLLEQSLQPTPISPTRLLNEHGYSFVDMCTNPTCFY